MDDMNAFERQVERRVHRFVGPARPVDDLAVFEAITAASRSPRWGFTMFSALKFVAAGVIVALFGGFLLAGVLTTQQGDEMVPAAVTEPPSPMTTEELLSGMVTEEVEPGVLRVDHDGVRDLTSADYWGVFAGQDGSIWLDLAGYPSRLGVAETHDWQLGEWKRLWDLEVTHDGTVWAVGIAEEESVPRSVLRSFDGETWTTHRAVGLLYGVGDVEVASDGVAWAALGDGTLGYLDADDSTWQTIETPTTRPVSVAAGSPAVDAPYEQGEFGLAIGLHGFIVTESDMWAPEYGGVWHYADGEWEHITYGGPDTGALPDDVFWGLGDGTLYRHDGTGWRQWSLEEYDMLAGGWDAEPYAVAPDGSFWAGWPSTSEEDWCQGVSRFDGRALVRYLPGTCVPWLGGMDIAPDGSVWVHAWEWEDPEDAWAGSGHLYVITPEAVAGAE